MANNIAQPNRLSSASAGSNNNNTPIANPSDINAVSTANQQVKVGVRERGWGGEGRQVGKSAKVFHTKKSQVAKRKAKRKESLPSNFTPKEKKRKVE